MTLPRDVSTALDMTKIRNFIDGQFVEPVGGKYLDNIEPATGKAYSQVPDSECARCRAGRRRGREGVRGLVAHARGGSVAHSPAHRRPDRARSRKIRARRIDRYRQAALARARPRHSAGRQQFPLLRDRDSSHRIRSARHRWRRVQLHPAPAARHRGLDLAVEPAALPVELENRARDCVRQHRHRQAERAYADDRLSALRDCREAGLPNGVLNVVHGTGPNVGAPITAHPKIGTISFTGGTVTGRKVAEACAPMFKKVSLELGGKIRTSSSPMPTSTPPSPAVSALRSRTRARSVCAVRVCSSNARLIRSLWIASLKKRRN